MDNFPRPTNGKSTQTADRHALSQPIQAMDQKQLLGIENVGIELKPIAEDKYNYGKK